MAGKQKGRRERINPFKYDHKVHEREYVPRMTFCIPSKNNLRYVKVAIESIRKNAR